jgi:hypothetical protein
VRRLHGLGITILQLQIVSDVEEETEIQEQHQWNSKGDL